MAFSMFQDRGTRSQGIPDQLGQLENGLVNRKGSVGRSRWLQDMQELVLRVLEVLHWEVENCSHASKWVMILAVVVWR